MEKFVVLVNNKWMVNVEANSLCGAEHVVLDAFADAINKTNCIEGCQAFGKKEMRTEYFWDMIQDAETISWKELSNMVDLVQLTDDYVKSSKEEEKRIQEELDELMKQVEEYKEALKIQKEATCNWIQKESKHLDSLRGKSI